VPYTGKIAPQLKYPPTMSHPIYPLRSPRPPPFPPNSSPPAPPPALPLRPPRPFSNLPPPSHNLHLLPLRPPPSPRVTPPPPVPPPSPRRHSAPPRRLGRLLPLQPTHTLHHAPGRPHRTAGARGTGIPPLSRRYPGIVRRRRVTYSIRWHS